jgi:hypothetical protein
MSGVVQNDKRIARLEPQHMTDLMRLLGTEPNLRIPKPGFWQKKAITAHRRGILLYFSIICRRLIILFGRKV